MLKFSTNVNTLYTGLKAQCGQCHTILKKNPLSLNCVY